ncbi:MAG: carbamoyltransferase HypF [Elusimicrobia bacterium]|nr:carbamoyltransferase HypF [Elusimicrobiota bacterium]
MLKPAQQAKKIIISGLVQGIGFRPFIYRLAKEHGICGWVLNSPKGVEIFAQGRAANVKIFTSEIKTKAPQKSRIDKLVVLQARSADVKKFEIKESLKRGAKKSIIPTDLAICPDCAREILDKADRRFLYPFANCTNCGPRFTIVKKMPYDRAFTTMREFKMCPDCAQEFTDPLNRRFHAQPNACDICGPQVYLGKLRGIRAMEKAAEQITKGEIIAIKSLGGFHLACDALNKKAVEKLRLKKSRPHKPFAIMAEALSSVKKFCHVSGEEEKFLLSEKAPAVMLKKRSAGFAPQVAPNLSALAVMVAYTPLHKILFYLLKKMGFNNPLVMTSANAKDEPICISDGEIRQKLSAVTDCMLSHNREIHNRCDDSVGFICDGKPRLTRRARGFALEPIKLSHNAISVLGMGGELKNTFCLTRQDEAFMSCHIGDMNERETENFYLSALSKMKKLLGARPAVIAHDLHPDYATTKLAAKMPGKKIAVQHHAAHIFSVMAEHKINSPVIGVAWDGTGYGPDGSIWGGEFMVADGKNWRRMASLKPVALPGADAGAIEIWRMGLSWLKTALGENWRKHISLFAEVDRKKLLSVDKMIDAKINCPLTSSMGRLFDAVSFLAGLRSEITYEGQAAMELEALCENHSAKFYSFEIHKKNGLLIIDPSPMIKEVIKEKNAKIIAEKFHATVVEMAAKTIEEISRKTKINKIALSGGVFQNKFLLELAEKKLSQKGFKVYANVLVPANDGGIALGQAWAAIKNMENAR